MRTRSINVPVFAHDIKADELSHAVRDYGFVVMETMRTTAKKLFFETLSILEINHDADNGPRLAHLSNKVDDRGWVDYLIHSDVFDLCPHRDQILTATVRAWIAAGEPDYCLTRVVLERR